MVTPAPVIPGEQHFMLSSLSPSRAQKRLALVLVLALLVAWLITDGALSTVQLGRIDAFIPAYATAMFVNDSITAVLLFAAASLRSAELVVPDDVTFEQGIEYSNPDNQHLQRRSCRGLDLILADAQRPAGGKKK